MNYVPRETALERRKYGERYLLSGGTAFGLKRTERGLVPAFSAAALSVSGTPSAVGKMYFSGSGDLYVYAAGTVYRSAGADGAFTAYCGGFSSAPYFSECHEGEENFIIISDGAVAYRGDGSSASADSCPPVKSGIVHFSRLFGTDASDARTVRWSAPGDVHGWDGALGLAGHVRLDAEGGDVLKLAVCGSELLAVRERGVTALHVSGDAETFRTDAACRFYEKVFADTAAVCGGKLYFFTPTGMYFYDGRVKKFSCEGLEGFSSPERAAACGGIYFVQGEYGGESAVACIDVSAGDVCYIKAQSSCMCGGGRAFLYDGGLRELAGEGSAGEWRCDCEDFGTAAKKYLHSVCVYGADTLKISCGGKTFSFASPEGEVKVGVTGRSFSFSATCSGELRSLCARYVVRG